MIRVGDIDAHVVGDNVLLAGRVQANLLDVAGETLVREGVDREPRLLALADEADVGFGEAGVDAHLGKVLGDLDQRWRLEAGCHRLAKVDDAVDDDAVDRRADDGEIEVGAVTVVLRPRQRHLRLPRLERLARLIVLLPRHILLRKQRLHARLVGLRQFQRRLRADDVGRALALGRGNQRIVQFEQGLAFFYLVVEIDIKLLDRTRHLGADADQDDRVERAVGRHRLRHVAPLDRRQLVALLGVHGGALFGVPDAAADQGGGQRRADEDLADAFHGLPSATGCSSV